MDFKTFETNFLTLLKNKDNNCIKLLDENEQLIEKNLGFHSNPKIIDKFVSQISDIVINIKSKNKILKIKNQFELIEKALNHPCLNNVKGAFINSDVSIKACYNKNKDAINWLLSTMHVNPRVQNEDGMTVLMAAAQMNYQSVIKPFLNNTECLNIEDKYGNNVLFYSVACPQFIPNEAISNNTYPRELIDSVIDINHINHNGETALIYCIKNENFKAINYLLKNPKLDVNVADKTGKTAAMYLVEKGKYMELSFLHRKNCNYDYININNNESVLSILLNKMYGSENDYKSISYKSYIQIFSVLVSYQIDFNSPMDNDENTAFMVILGMKDFDSACLCAKHLRRLDLSVKNKYGENATSLCFKFGFPEILDILKNNVTFNYYFRDAVNQNTLLMFSVVNKCIFIKELLENDPNIINDVNCKNENALIIATKINQVKAVEILLNYGININQQDDLGNTALHYAIKIEQPKLVQMIMNKNPKVDLKNNDGKTALMLAKEIDNAEVLKVLNDPSCSIKSSDERNTKQLEIYRKEIQAYVTPYINNKYPDYKCTKEMKKNKEEIYYRFIGTNFKRTIINNIILI